MKRTPATSNDRARTLRAGFSARLFGAGLFAVGLVACAGRAGDGGTDTNTNWLQICEEDPGCTELDPAELDPRQPGAGAPPLDDPHRSASDRIATDPMRSTLESSTTGGCAVRCEALLGGACRDDSSLPTLGQTRLAWTGSQCATGALLEGTCESGTRFVWRGGDGAGTLGVHRGEVRYFDETGHLVGLSSFAEKSDPSTCQGVRRWPGPVPCSAPILTSDLCAESALPPAFRSRFDAQ